MKKGFQRCLVLSMLVTSLCLELAQQSPAQSFKTLYRFTAGSLGLNGWLQNSDGISPSAVILSSNVLYGTAIAGGSAGRGTVFAVNIDGTGFGTLHSFTDLDCSSYPCSNSDGASPAADAGLALLGATLYGATELGGLFADGTIFSVNTDGTGFIPLYSFSDSDTGGSSPSALIISGGGLYGVIGSGGRYGNGRVFKIDSDGTGLASVYDFTAAVGGTNGHAINSDGIRPQTLVSSDNRLYGSADVGGNGGSGTVFALHADGTGFAILHDFSSTTPCCGPYTNSDGVAPQGLVLSGNTLYGSTYFGGLWGNGTVFKVNTDGTGFTTLHTFTATSGPNSTNYDGSSPRGSLIVLGNVVYGVAYAGGRSGVGTVFAINTDGTDFQTLHTFAGVLGYAHANPINSDGANPYGGLILSGNTLYGTTFFGGSSGNGTVFSISLLVTAPQLTITPGSQNIVLTWPTNVTAFTLQSTTNLGSLGVWTTNSSGAVIVNGQNTVTNPLSGAQEFYRLSE